MSLCVYVRTGSWLHTKPKNITCHRVARSLCDSILFGARDSSHVSINSSDISTYFKAILEYLSSESKFHASLKVRLFLLCSINVLLPILLYFMIRLDGRAKEIELSIEGASKIQPRSLSSAANDAFRQLNKISFAQSTSPIFHSKAPQTQDWRRNDNYRRMTMQLFGRMHSQEIPMEGAAEGTEQVNPVSGENLDDKDSERATKSVVNTRLEKMSHFITVYFGLSEAWRQNPFK